MMMEPPPARRVAGTAYFTDRNTVEVHRRLSPPVGQRHLDSLAHDADAGVGDHHVQTPEAPLGCFDYARPALLEAHVLMKEDRLAANATDLGDHCLAPRIVQVGYHNLR